MAEGMEICVPFGKMILAGPVPVSIWFRPVMVVIGLFDGRMFVK